MKTFKVKVSFLGSEHDIQLTLDNEELKNLDHEQMEGIIKENLFEHMTISWSEKKLPVSA